jgi:hypothetical protein
MIGTVRAIADLETSHVSISSSRPSGNSDGVDISSWHAYTSNGGTGPTGLSACMVVLAGDGTDRTISSPTGGTAGVEIHAQILLADNTKKWCLVGTLDNGSNVAVPGSGAAMRELALIGYAQRLAVAGTPSAGTPTYFFQPLAVGDE